MGSATVTLFVLSLATGQMWALDDLSTTGCNLLKDRLMGASAADAARAETKAIDVMLAGRAERDKWLDALAVIGRNNAAKDRLIVECLERQ